MSRVELIEQVGHHLAETDVDRFALTPSGARYGEPLRLSPRSPVWLRKEVASQPELVVDKLSWAEFTYLTQLKETRERFGGASVGLRRTNTILEAWQEGDYAEHGEHLREAVIPEIGATFVLSNPAVAAAGMHSPHEEGSIYPAVTGKADIKDGLYHTKSVDGSIVVTAPQRDVIGILVAAGLCKRPRDYAITPEHGREPPRGPGRIISEGVDLQPTIMEAYAGLVALDPEENDGNLIITGWPHDGDPPQNWVARPEIPSR